MSPTTTWLPSVTITPLTVRALWVAGSPHQQRGRTCSISIRSHSSTRRRDAGKSSVRKSVRIPKQNTSICSSSTIRASWSMCAGV